MAPLSQEVQSVSSCSPPHLGPAIAEMNSIWYRLWLYQKLGSGPPSLLLAKGNRLRRLPALIKVGLMRHCNSVWRLGGVSVLVIRCCIMHRSYYGTYIQFLLQGYSRVVVTTWGHDPTVVLVSNLLLTVNDALTHSAVLVQVRGCGFCIWGR